MKTSRMGGGGGRWWWPLLVGTGGFMVGDSVAFQVPRMSLLSLQMKVPSSWMTTTTTTTIHHPYHQGSSSFLGTSSSGASLPSARRMATTSTRLYYRSRRTITIHDDDQDNTATVQSYSLDLWDGRQYRHDCDQLRSTDDTCQSNDGGIPSRALTTATTAVSTPSVIGLLGAATAGWIAWTASTWQAYGANIMTPDKIFSQTLTPENFQPVCPTSDGIYRVLQAATSSVVGPENFQEYGPLISGGLLRVRLELCVVESFFNEAVGPFIAQNGLSWVLPLHETVETFLAGVIFAFVTTFILIGSTKILTVLIVYTDFVLGLPARVLGGFTFDRASGKPVTLDIGLGKFKTRLIGPPNEDEKKGFDLSKLNIFGLTVLLVSGTVKVFGEVVGFFRDILEGFDFFVGRYLVLWASAYILLKFIHFKVFPDFP